MGDTRGLVRVQDGDLGNLRLGEIGVPAKMTGTEFEQLRLDWKLP